jgi:16S rRNA G966 N2-methylase RsmD
MLMEFSKDLKKQSIYAIGQEINQILGDDRDEEGNLKTPFPIEEKRLVAEIFDPVLLQDHYTINKLEPTKRDTVLALFRRNPLINKYNEVSVSWDSNLYPTVWTATIDTYVFLASTETSGDILTDEVKSITDIGCGVGFLGLYVASKCKNTRELILDDINPKAIDCARENMKNLRKNILVGYYTDDGRKLAGKKSDLVLLSPPYVPRPKTIEGTAYEGVGLLHDIIVNGKKYLTKNGKLIVTTSSLCQDIAEQAIDEAKSKGLVSWKSIGGKRVPLKVMSILNNKKWMSYLLDRGLKKTAERGYEYWHEISILKLMYN